MNSIIITDNASFDTAVNALALEGISYRIDSSNLAIFSDDIESVAEVLIESGITEYSVCLKDEEPFDGFRTDAEADADALASAGMGTDEDYGYYGNDE